MHDMKRASKVRPILLLVPLNNAETGSKKGPLGQGYCIHPRGFQLAYFPYFRTVFDVCKYRNHSMDRFVRNFRDFGNFNNFPSDKKGEQMPNFSDKSRNLGPAPLILQKL